MLPREVSDLLRPLRDFRSLSNAQWGNAAGRALKSMGSSMGSTSHIDPFKFLSLVIPIARLPCGICGKRMIYRGDFCRINGSITLMYASRLELCRLYKEGKISMSRYDYKVMNEIEKIGGMCVECDGDFEDFMSSHRRSEAKKSIEGFVEFMIVQGFRNREAGRRANQKVRRTQPAPRHPDLSSESIQLAANSIQHFKL